MPRGDEDRQTSAEGPAENYIGPSALYCRSHLIPGLFATLRPRALLFLSLRELKQKKAL